MLYTVECNYTDPESEQEWNTFYSQQKLPALISVAGFSSSQRFKALKPCGSRYLAIHTVKYAEVLTSEEYKLKGAVIFHAGKITSPTGSVICMSVTARHLR